MTNKKQKKSMKDPYENREASRYDSPILSREAILDFLEKEDEPVSKSRILKVFKYKQSKKIAIEKRLNAMVRDGQIICTRRGNFALVNKLMLHKGRVTIQKDGFGMVVVEGNQKIILSPRQTKTLMNGDTVLVRVGQKVIRGKKLGILVEIIERSHKAIVGQYIEEPGSRYVMPYGRQLSDQNVLISQLDAKAKNGDYVIVELERYPSDRQLASGRVTKVIEASEGASLEVTLAIIGFGIPYEWDDKVLAELKNLPKRVEQSQGRVDLRDKPFVTIDGIDAKDFDDAVYVEADSDGGWVLYVAIADVAHYVEMGSALDKSAYLRGNSVYFPNQVIPMLPEVLSNGLCSLLPNEDRLVMVAKMKVSASGALRHYDFCRAIIHSGARLTYTEVAEMVGGDREVPDFWRESFKCLHDLYHQLAEQRAKRGAIEFDTIETKIYCDSLGNIEAIKPSKRTIAHCFIEECMLLANQSVAMFLLESEFAALYRVHAQPLPEKIEQLHKFLGHVGLQLKGGLKPTPGHFNDVLQKAKKRDDFELIQTVLLRSMTQAIYSHENKGHFGLAFDAYCHFTSPIRRYPDLLAHRALAAIINGQSRQESLDLTEEMGLHCSQTERRADEAVRDVTNRLKCYYMKDKVGQIYSGKIVSVTSFGLFVCLDDVYVEGLVHITALPNDYYLYEENQHLLIGKRTRLRYGIGMKVRIEVTRVDVIEGHIDFSLVE